MNNKEVAFRLVNYKFTKATLNFDIPKDAEFVIDFKPSGKLKEIKGTYDLSFDTIVKCEETDTIIVEVSCIAQFSFMDRIKFEEIPDFFYPNSLAILFPYIRAFVSTLSLQANSSPMILPTVNLMGLTEKLRDNTSVVE
ncbi:protein-export chaperone SecB [Prevotella denticola]|uniref:protein-export chaperone SecB n=1 Tax=Prevotella denticola TaxID=28129 RepID=UPI0005620E39|nr:protein-export chaperone SecB [Prevotella denticola]QUB93841.1 protein-export chaperone SecB [Prevotella denticola]